MPLLLPLSVAPLRHPRSTIHGAVVGTRIHEQQQPQKISAQLDLNIAAQLTFNVSGFQMHFDRRAFSYLKESQCSHQQGSEQRQTHPGCLSRFQLDICNWRFVYIFREFICIWINWQFTFYTRVKSNGVNHRTIIILFIIWLSLPVVGNRGPVGCSPSINYRWCTLSVDRVLWE